MTDLLRSLARTFLLVIVAALSYLILTSDPVEEFLFDPAHAHEFFMAKGIVGAVVVALYVMHMSTVWTSLANLAQRMRYLALFFGAALVTSASVEQVQDEALVNWRNIGGMAFILYLGLTVVVSMAMAGPRYQSNA